MKYFSVKDVVNDLRQVACSYHSNAELARAIGVTRSHFSRVIRGEKNPDGKILKWLGYRKAVLFEAISK